MKMLFVALPLIALGLTAAPALAAEDARCTALPAAIEAAIPSADPDTARTASRYLANGKALCQHRNRRAANEQFQAAARLLGLGADGASAAHRRAEAPAGAR